MATFSIIIDDAHVGEVFDAFAVVFGYPATIPNPMSQLTVIGVDGNPEPDPNWEPTVPNPQSKQAFARVQVIAWIKLIVDQYRTQQALSAAQAAAAAAVPPVIQ